MIQKKLIISEISNINIIDKNTLLFQNSIYTACHCWTFQYFFSPTNKYFSLKLAASNYVFVSMN